jgi:hypothetical protein
MNANSPSDRSAQEKLVVDVESSRDIRPAEADKVLRECLSLTHRRLDAAIWLALEELAAVPQHDRGAAAELRTSGLERNMPDAFRSRRALFGPRFRAEFEQAFQRRREGKPRTRGQRDNASRTLSIVDYGDHTAQVALKSAVLAMHEATLAEAFELDSRVRTLLREASSANPFDNPWSADYICDALGNACREVWPDDGLWRPIMARLVCATTQQVAALHRELNVLLQDRGMLPAVRVRAQVHGNTV